MLPYYELSLCEICTGYIHDVIVKQLVDFITLAYGSTYYHFMNYLTCDSRLRKIHYIYYIFMIKLI